MGGADKILSAMSLLFLSNFFQSSTPAGKFISLQLYWLIKGLILDILCGFFPIFSWFNATVKAFKCIITAIP